MLLETRNSCISINIKREKETPISTDKIVSNSLAISSSVMLSSFNVKRNMINDPIKRARNARVKARLPFFS